MEICFPFVKKLENKHICIIHSKDSISFEKFKEYSNTLFERRSFSVLKNLDKGIRWNLVIGLVFASIDEVCGVVPEPRIYRCPKELEILKNLSFDVGFQINDKIGLVEVKSLYKAKGCPSFGNIDKFYMDPVIKKIANEHKIFSFGVLIETSKKNKNLEVPFYIKRIRISIGKPGVKNFHKEFEKLKKEIYNFLQKQKFL